MEKVMTFSTTKKKFFRQYLELLNPIVKLRPKELDVLAELLHYNNELSNIDEKNRWKVIFDYDNKKEMATSLDISVASFGNNLSYLRQKGIIVDNKVVKNLLVYPEDSFNLKFNFNISE